MKRAIESYKTTGYDPDNHFRGGTKMVRLGSGAELAIKEFNLQLPDRRGSGVPTRILCP
jgi:DNA-damage-inducible protein D